MAPLAEEAVFILQGREPAPPPRALQMGSTSSEVEGNTALNFVGDDGTMDVHDVVWRMRVSRIREDRLVGRGDDGSDHLQLHGIARGWLR
jgi:hypothetical protein